MFDPKFKNINRFFFLLFKNDDDDSNRYYFNEYYMLLVEIKDFNASINNKSFKKKQTRSV